MVCEGGNSGAFADNVMYKIAKWFFCEFPDWISSLFSWVVSI